MIFNSSKITNLVKLNLFVAMWILIKLIRTIKRLPAFIRNNLEIKTKIQINLENLVQILS